MNQTFTVFDVRLSIRRVCLRLTGVKRRACFLLLFQALVWGVYAQNGRNIQGKVVDETNIPLPGVSVKVIGTSAGAITTVDGVFEIFVPAGADSLAISYVGYITKRIHVNDASSTVKLEPSKTNDLNEVVVVAFSQKQRKIETLGAQSTLNVAELKQPVANITTVLAGRISGLVGVQRSAEPGLDNANLWIRGVSTLSNATPLVLVDGVERDFSNLDPNDIESFSILKDASSTSVYGVRGANGVILITTKRGKAGRTNINLDYYKGYTQFTRVPQIADGVTYMQMTNEASVTRGGVVRYSPDAIKKTMDQSDPYLYPNINWFDQIFSDFGSNEKANVNINGGSENATFNVSAGFYNEKGLFKTDGLKEYNSEISFKRYNFLSALDIKATKTTTVSLGIKGFISYGNYPGVGTSDIFAAAYNTTPIMYPLSFPNGVEPFQSTGGGMVHPLSLLTNRGYTTQYNNQINSDIRVNQDLSFLVKGLSARILYAFDATNNNRLNRTKTPQTAYLNGRDAQGNLIYVFNPPPASEYLNFDRSSGGSRQFYLEGAINYNNIFGKHRVGGLLLYNQSDYTSASATDLIGSLPYRSLGAVGRLTYSYDDRYLLEGSFGYNGAENFAPDTRFGFFPSGALGWVVSNEKFFEKAKNVFQLFKLRASYGLVGSSRIDGRRFAYAATVAEGLTGYNYGKDRGNAIPGLDIGEYAATVTWETEKDLNLGIELKTLDALNIQADYFTRRRENIFLTRGAVPAFVGLRSNLLGNLGIVTSKGIDLSLDYNKNFGKLNVNVKGTYTYNTNKVVENDTPVPAFPYQQSRGQAVSQRFGYIAEGFYTQAEIDNPAVARTAGTVQAGDLKYRDMNADGIIDGNDRAPIGQNEIPQVIYGFGTTLGYKNFSLGAFFQGVAKVDLYLADQFLPFKNGTASGNMYANITDRWIPENPRQDAFYPRLAIGNINQNFAESSHWLQNGKFLRLKTLDFGYTIPKGSLARIGVQNMRIYFVGYNLLTFSPYKLFDPELGNGSGTRYPNIKTYSLGITAKF